MKTTYMVLMLIFTGQALAGQAEGMRENLDLTAEQQEKMQVVKLATHERLKASREQIMADSQAQMAEFLTPEQMEKIEAMHAHRQEHGHMRKQHRKMQKRRHKEAPSDG